MIKKYNQFINEGLDIINEVEVDVIDKDDTFINNIINKLSFVYRKRKERYMRPIKIVGSTKLNDIDIIIDMSNGDNVEIIYKNSDELKIDVNNQTIYHMDDIIYNIVSDKVKQIYIQYIEKQKIKIKQNKNPFI